MDTHKFESRYLDTLIGPYPQDEEIYKARSPINHTGQLDCALALFQGSEDKVCPPDQSIKMYEAVRDKGRPVVYKEFEGEQHGFRQAKNIKFSLDGEFLFLLPCVQF
ncbi:Esterase lipase thioesterase active site [Desmophyllum pertusum]|uniref:Esterase lipase thioesterase active site n=1 Tax=Desmophyllum pertusum TaxID=174260 RepID=A0A9X0D819_9CNID|nr:Esterase lipase thioesterase active site [Desmophyllum pertusum]